MRLPHSQQVSRAQDIVSNWALSVGYTEVTFELLDLMYEVASALEQAQAEGCKANAENS